MKIIQLKQNGMGRYADVSPFPLGDMEIELQGLPAYSGEFRFLAYCNGAACVESTVSAARNRVSISRDKLFAGRFSCLVIHYLKGMEVKRYPVEDLLVTDLDRELSADPEIARMMRRIESLERELALEKDARRIADERSEQAAEERRAQDTEKARANFLSLVKFAYKDYLENVYLESGGFEDFVNEFGFGDLAAEEIRYIKGEGK